MNKMNFFVVALPFFPFFPRFPGGPGGPTMWRRRKTRKRNNIKALSSLIYTFIHVIHDRKRQNEMLNQQNSE